MVTENIDIPADSIRDSNTSVWMANLSAMQSIKYRIVSD